MKILRRKIDESGHRALHVRSVVADVCVLIRVRIAPTGFEPVVRNRQKSGVFQKSQICAARRNIKNIIAGIARFVV